MAARSDDDVPDTPSGQAKAVNGDERDDAGDTTAARRTPASAAKARPPPDGSGDGEDDRTVRRSVDTKLLRAERTRLTSPPVPKLGGVQPRDTKPPAPAIRMTSKKATAQGLGVPQSLSRRTASMPPPPPPKADDTNEADAVDDSSITATAPALAARTGASIVPSTAGLAPVKISELGEDEGDETEVRTFVATFAGVEPSPRPSPAPAAGRPPATSRPPVPARPAASRPPAPLAPATDEGAEAIDDSVTTQAPSIGGLPADDEPRTQPPILSPAAMSSPNGARPPAKSIDMYETDESVTSRGPAVAEYDDDDSITAEGPAVDRAGRRILALPSSAARPASPIRLTESDDDDEDEEGDEHPNNQTAVMINAPVKPPSPAPLFATTPMTASPLAVRTVINARESDSGLRIAPVTRTEIAGEHASVGVLLADTPRAPRFSDPDGDGRVANPFAATAPAFLPIDPLAAHPSGEIGVAKKPNYGLIVGVVAGLSIVIPLVLYFALRGAALPEPRIPSEVVPDPVGVADGSRPRAPSTKPLPAPPSTAPRTPWWRRR